MNIHTVRVHVHVLVRLCGSVCLSTFLLVFILEREAANLHGATGGYTELSPQLFSGYSQ